MTIVVLPATAGLTAAPSFAAEAVAAKGGCWAYSVDGTTAEDDAETLVSAAEAAVKDPSLVGLTDGLKADHAAVPAVSPIVSHLAWSPSPEGAELRLTSDGDTARNGERGFELSLTSGPALQLASAAPAAGEKVAGTAYAALLAYAPDFAVGDTPERIFARTDFEADAGQSVGDLTFTTEEGLKLASEGEYRVVLQSVYFVAPGADAAAAPQMWVCNAQEETKPSADFVIDDDGVATPGLNPLTQPVQMSDVSAGFSVQDVSVLHLADVRGQSVTSHVRLGDTLVLSTTGMETETVYSVGFGSGDTFVLADEQITTDAEGASSEVVVTVPEGVSAGPEHLQLVAADGNGVGPVLDIAVLGAPALMVTEKATDNSLELTVFGSDFDPNAQVRLRSRAGAAAGSDSAVRISADAQGRFEATYTVEDVDATALRALQARQDARPQLEAVHQLVEAVPAPGATVPPAPIPKPDAPPAPVTTTPAAPTVVPVAPVTPPVAIPIPAPLPLQQIPAPQLTAEVTPELKVSEARLEGSPSAGELFGGSSRRQVAFEVENVGTGPATNPQVLLGVGRTAEAEPGLVATELGDLQPGARVAVSVNVALPMASFGTYQVVGQVGDEAATEFTIRWDTYPWGLITVNALGVGLLVWGVTRRRRSVAPLPTGPSVEEAGASVVDLTALDKWWQEGKVVHTRVVVEEDNDSVVDLDAADRWWSRNQNKVS